MKSLLFLFSLLILTACSTTEFNRNVNCSTRALAYLDSETNKKIDTNMSESLKEQNYTNSIELMNSLTAEIKKCYQEKMDEGLREEYRTCVVVSIDEKRKISFLDVDDRSKVFNSDLKACIVKIIESSDTSKIQSTTLVQPFNFNSVRL